MDPKETNILEEIAENFNQISHDTTANYWEKGGKERLYFQGEKGTKFGYLEIVDGEVLDRNLKMGGDSRQILKSFLAEKSIPNTLTPKYLQK